MALLIPPRRVLLVVNPAARRAARLVEPARRAVRAAGAQCDVAMTERPGHAAELAAALAPGTDAVLTLGGDGTAMEVIDRLAHTGHPVGILAGGTGNQLARALGIPLDVRRAVPRLLAGTARRLDLGAVAGGRRFALTLGIGPDVRMIAETSAAAKRRFGVAAYAASAVRAIAALERFVVTLDVDGTREAHEVNAVMVANLPGVQEGRVTFGPGILPDDGILDVCLYRWASIPDAITTFWRAATGGIARDPSTCVRRGRRIRLTTDPVRRAEADGELLAEGPFDISVEPLAATLLVPGA